MLLDPREHSLLMMKMAQEMGYLRKQISIACQAVRQR
jgi:hypothetical protein